jgi:hypothetical protein
MIEQIAHRDVSTAYFFEFEANEIAVDRIVQRMDAARLQQLCDRRRGEGFCNGC